MTYSCKLYVNNRISIDAMYPKHTQCPNCGTIADTNLVGFNHFNNYHHQCPHCYHVAFVNTHNDEGIFKVVSNVPRNMPSDSMCRGEIEDWLASDATGPHSLENLAYIETMVKAMRALEVMTTKVRSLIEERMTDEEFNEEMRDLSYWNPLRPAFHKITEEYELDRRNEQEFINNSEKEDN